MRMTTIGAASTEEPGIIVHLSGRRSWQGFLQRLLMGSFLHGKGFLPPPFYATMSEKIDPRQAKLAQGLGVFEGKRGKFYPMAGMAKGDIIEDVWLGRRLQVERRISDGMLHAVWSDTGEEPMQLLTRWYGFSFTFPGCDVWER